MVATRTIADRLWSIRDAVLTLIKLTGSGQ